jgi:hypothetical protein
MFKKTKRKQIFKNNSPAKWMKKIDIIIKDIRLFLDQTISNQREIHTQKVSKVIHKNFRMKEGLFKEKVIRSKSMFFDCKYFIFNHFKLLTY